MAATNRPFLVESIEGGVDSSKPSHLVRPPQWLVAHNMRFDPRCEQVPLKKLHATLSGENDILALPMVPGATQGYGRVLVMTKDKLMRLDGTPLETGFSYDSQYRRWSFCFYNGFVYFTNELNQICRTDGISCAVVANAPKGRYVLTWYDHLVTAVGNKVLWSHLYDFTTWTPDATNEADHYDLVEWQNADYPFSGITGIGKIGGTLWVYTPTAIVPFRYTGIRQGTVQLVDDSVLTRIGNTYPWTLATLDRTHFFYDGIEQNFFAFDGSNPTPIGEPIRQYISDNLNPLPALAAKMWASVDVQNREIWWRFVSKDSVGPFDKAVVFNYRLRLWFTASTENIQAFCGSVFVNGTMAELTGTMEDLTGAMRDLLVSQTQIPRLYGADGGKLYRDEVPGDSTASLVASEDPVLESGDFLYGSLHAMKEARAIAVNASWDPVRDSTMKLEVGVAARDYLDDSVDWTVNKAGEWSRTLPEGRLTHEAKSGKVLRYRFVGKNSRGLKFTAYEPTVYSQGAEK